LADQALDPLNFVQFWNCLLFTLAFCRLTFLATEQFDGRTKIGKKEEEKGQKENGKVIKMAMNIFVEDWAIPMLIGGHRIGEANCGKFLRKIIVFFLEN
jgi:hypothetical protein